MRRKTKCLGWSTNTTLHLHSPQRFGTAENWRKGGSAGLSDSVQTVHISDLLGNEGEGADSGRHDLLSMACALFLSEISQENKVKTAKLMFQVSNCKLQNVGNTKVLSHELLVQMQLAITGGLPEKALDNFVKEEVCKTTELGVVFCEMLLKVLAENWESSLEARELGRIIFDVIFAEIDVWLEQNDVSDSTLANSKKVVLLFCFLCVNLDSIGRAIFELVGGSRLGEGEVRVDWALETSAITITLTLANFPNPLLSSLRSS